MAKDVKTYYNILGLTRNASEEDIKKEFRRLSMELHPDRAPGDKDKEARWKEVSEAYDTLVDKDKRKQYDAASTPNKLLMTEDHFKPYTFEDYSREVSETKSENGLHLFKRILEGDPLRGEAGLFTGATARIVRSPFYGARSDRKAVSIRLYYDARSDEALHSLYNPENTVAALGVVEAYGVENKKNGLFSYIEFVVDSSDGQGIANTISHRALYSLLQDHPVARILFRSGLPHQDRLLDFKEPPAPRDDDISEEEYNAALDRRNSYIAWADKQKVNPLKDEHLFARENLLADLAAQSFKKPVKYNTDTFKSEGEFADAQESFITEFAPHIEYLTGEVGGKIVRRAAFRFEGVKKYLKTLSTTGKSEAELFSILSREIAQFTDKNFDPFDDESLYGLPRTPKQSNPVGLVRCDETLQPSDSGKYIMLPEKTFSALAGMGLIQKVVAAEAKQEFRTKLAPHLGYLGEGDDVNTAFSFEGIREYLQSITSPKATDKALIDALSRKLAGLTDVTFDPDTNKKKNPAGLVRCDARRQPDTSGEYIMLPEAIISKLEAQELWPQDIDRFEGIKYVAGVAATLLTKLAPHAVCLEEKKAGGEIVKRIAFRLDDVKKSIQEVYTGHHFDETSESQKDAIYTLSDDIAICTDPAFNYKTGDINNPSRLVPCDESGRFRTSGEYILLPEDIAAKLKEKGLLPDDAPGFEQPAKKASPDEAKQEFNNNLAPHIGMLGTGKDGMGEWMAAFKFDGIKPYLKTIQPDATSDRALIDALSQRIADLTGKKFHPGKDMVRCDGAMQPRRSGEYIMLTDEVLRVLFEKHLIENAILPNFDQERGTAASEALKPKKRNRGGSGRGE